MFVWGSLIRQIMCLCYLQAWRRGRHGRVGREDVRGPRDESADGQVRSQHRPASRRPRRKEVAVLVPRQEAGQEQEQEPVQEQIQEQRQTQAQAVEKQKQIRFKVQIKIKKLRTLLPAVFWLTLAMKWWHYLPNTSLLAIAPTLEPFISFIHSNKQTWPKLQDNQETIDEESWNVDKFIKMRTVIHTSNNCGLFCLTIQMWIYTANNIPYIRENLCFQTKRKLIMSRYGRGIPRDVKG